MFMHVHSFAKIITQCNLSNVIPTDSLINSTRKLGLSELKAFAQNLIVTP